MTKPTFFIVGAPKSGTTSLHYYLQAHPQLFVPTRKEMHYFSLDVPLTGRVESLEEYNNYFVSSRPNQLCGEKSVFYLYSRTAAGAIASYAPEAKIIVMLRHPVDMLFSLHRQFLFSGNEDILDFKEALNAERLRASGQRLPPKAHNPTALQYSRVADYSTQLRRYIEVFGRERVHLIFFDDFATHTAEEYRRVLDFLAVRPDSMPEFVVHNPSKPVPPVRMRQVAKQHPIVHNLIRTIPPTARKAVRRRLHVIQRQPSEKLDPPVRRELSAYFQGGIEELSRMTGKNLAHWLA